jgi:hypothetical protein
MNATINETAYMRACDILPYTIRQNLMEKRAYILARDSHICQYCFGESGNHDLQKHHIHAKSKGGSDDTRNLITVCGTCHRIIHSGCRELYHRSTKLSHIPTLSEEDLQQVKQSLRKLMLGEIKEIAAKARQGEMQAEGEAFFIDSAIKAYVEIEKTLRKSLMNIIPWSLVFDKEDYGAFFETHAKWLLPDMAHRRYTWIIDPLNGLEAFRNPDDGNYHIAVMLLKNDAPVASFVYFPEYESGYAEEALFEASGEELQTS